MRVEGSKKYCDDVSVFCVMSVVEDEHHPGTYWLGSIARGTMHAYTESILRIHELTPFSTQQLLADIGELTSGS